MSEVQIVLLVKVFDREEYADAFLDKGEMFCKTLGQFKNIENDEQRGDKYEGVTDWHQPDKIAISISFTGKDGQPKSFDIAKLAGPFIAQNKGLDALNLYCLYAVKMFEDESENPCNTEEEFAALLKKTNAKLQEESRLHDEMLQLGETAVVIYNVREFIEKVEGYFSKLNQTCAHGLVGYYDPSTFHGRFEGVDAAFKKRNLYAHQSEYRFAFYLPNPIGAKTIHIGSLKGIAVKIPTKDYNENLRLTRLPKPISD